MTRNLKLDMWTRCKEKVEMIVSRWGQRGGGRDGVYTRSRNTEIERRVWDMEHVHTSKTCERVKNQEPRSMNTRIKKRRKRVPCGWGWRMSGMQGVVPTTPSSVSFAWIVCLLFRVWNGVWQRFYCSCCCVSLVSVAWKLRVTKAGRQFFWARKVKRLTFKSPPWLPGWLTDHPCLFC